MAIAPAAAATQPNAAPATGGWAVQLGVRPSEGEARAAFAQFQAKHPELKSESPIIRQAEVNGSTIYRVRVGPLSKDDASSLCSRLQGSGGQCFVAKN
jgi:cell division septation protein DedD